MNIIRVLIFSILVGGINNYSLQAITYNDAAVGTVATGVGVASISWLIAYLTSAKNMNKIIGVSTTTAMASIGTFAACKTPHIRAWRAHRIIKSCQSYPYIDLIKKYYQKNDELVASLKQNYLYTDFSLIHATIELEKLGSNLHDATRLLACAKKDFPDDPSFVQNCETNISQTEALLRFVNSAITTLKLDPTYLEQRYAHESKTSSEKIRKQFIWSNINFMWNNVNQTLDLIKDLAQLLSKKND